jgi:hypothetical protein
LPDFIACQGLALLLDLNVFDKDSKSGAHFEILESDLPEDWTFGLVLFTIYCHVSFMLPQLSSFSAFQETVSSLCTEANGSQQYIVI